MAVRLTAAWMAGMAKKKPNLAPISVPAVQRQGDATTQDCARRACHPCGRDLSKGCSMEPDFSNCETWQGQWMTDRSKLAELPVELNPVQELTGAPGSADWAPPEAENGAIFSQVSRQLGAKEVWTNVGEAISQVQASGGIAEKTNWDTPEWVKQALKMKTACKQAGEGISRNRKNNGKFASGNSVEMMSAQSDVFSWTARIFQHAKCGQSRQALRVYIEMREAGVKPSSYATVSALKACSSLRDLESARQIHSEVIKSGLEADLYVATMLIDVYAKCGSLVEARDVFERMPYRDVVSWNAMILGHAQLEEGEEALQLYAQMQQENLIPTDRTFVAALKACSTLVTSQVKNQPDGILGINRCLEQVRTIQSHITKRGPHLDVFVGNMLMDVYAKCGSLMDARCVFEYMPQRDVVSWNVIIMGYAQIEEGEEALQLYARMLQEGVAPDDRTFIGALKACSCMTASDKPDLCLEQVRCIHSDVVKSGSGTAVFVGTMLVDVYVKCGMLGDARDVFEKMPHHDVVSWNAMILGYAQRNEGAEALSLFARMQQEGVLPDEQTVVSILKACSSLAILEEERYADGTHTKQRCLQMVRSIHSQIVMRCGFELGESVGNMLVDVYAKCGSVIDARRVFEKIPRRDVVSWNAMILGYAHLQEGEKALELYNWMKQEDVVPDDRTFVGALKACSTLLGLEEGSEADRKSMRQHHLLKVRSIHSDIVESGYVQAACVGTMLVDVYAKSGLLLDARHIFEQIPCRDVVSWTAMILGYVQVKDGEEALALYASMQSEGVMPDDRTFVSALKACGLVAGLDRGKDIHCQILESAFVGADSFVWSSLVDMYSKCGSMVDAQQVFDSLFVKDIVTWNALIAGYARHGDSKLVLDLFERMSQEGFQPNEITFLSVLSVCSHVGLVEEGHLYFEAMSVTYGISPSIEHYGCMVDLFGRAGNLDKAMKMVKTMPFQPPVELWRCLLGSCRKWSCVDLGRHAFQCAVALDKADASSYILMSNIYCAAHMQDDAWEVQAMRIEAQAWKQPVHTWWTDIGGNVHTFVVRDREHPECHRVYAKLGDLFEKMLDEESGVYLTSTPPLTAVL